MGTKPMVAKAYLHKWEEPCISGKNGSGTVFFSGCNLKCVFCQNYQISQENFGKEVSIDDLSKIFLLLQLKGAHNISLVNPTHFVAQIREAVLNIEKELTVPVVYNSNGYESSECLKLMEGIVDIYLPDLKYFDKDVSLKYSGAQDYFEVASGALLKMYRQAGGARFDELGLLKKGLVVRHLILPGHTKDSIKILDWIKENLPGDIIISLMSQYTPYYKACRYPEINRRITRKEYDRVVNHLLKLGFKNGFVQERSSADEEYIPEFDLEGVIFE